jgi:hypothetical protein
LKRIHAERCLWVVFAGGLLDEVIVNEEFPRAYVLMMQTVKDLKLMSIMATRHSWVDKLTTHMPFQAAIKVETPRMRRMIGKTRHPRPRLLIVKRMSVTMPAKMRKIPRPRANKTRGLLPLQMAWRTKLGCAC